MQKRVEFNKVVLWSLWLPIVGFSSLREHLSSHVKFLEDRKNSTWIWVVFEYEGVKVTLDSLGFVYFEHILSAEQLKSVLLFLSEMLNEETKIQITDTFLNRQIGYKEELEKGEIASFKSFLESIVVPFESIEEKVKLEYISSHLHIDLSKKSRNESEDINCKYKISSIQNMKFSLDTENYKIDRKFQTILNRNFENLLRKSIHHTHSLNFEDGEIYNLDILDIEHGIVDWIDFELSINDENRNEEKEKIFKQIVQKALQDTLEEYTIFYFLKVTRRRYLRSITDEISKKNKLLKRLNAYLLDDTEGNLFDVDKLHDSADDESTVEIFIQNLLQSMPKFFNIDSKIKEAYYVKIGNTSTNLQVKDNETIINTLYYTKWKSSIAFFMETATKVNDSLTMYHQNKTRKELEDISYHANYQADIEDIRELQKNKELFLDSNTKTILFLIAVAALAGEAPLMESEKLPLFTIDTLAHSPFWQKFFNNFIDIFSNSMIYGAIIYFFIKPLSFKKEDSSNRIYRSNVFKKLFDKIKYSIFTDNSLKFYFFDESDYDKHEHRSTKLLLSYSPKLDDRVKNYVSYNRSISSYVLVQELKEKTIVQKIDENIIEFALFPELLRETPLDKDHEYIYRENYRISGNDRVATKVMYRYKISELKLEDLLTYMRNDTFMQGYSKYLLGEGFSIDEQYDILEPSLKKSSYLTLYIVYSFVLKFNNIDKNGEYRYVISKDQFRVHYHINKLEYRNREEFNKKQGALAHLIDIYFLRRLKRTGKV